MPKHPNPLRITFVLPYAGIAGGIRVLAIYAQRLQDRGHHVQIVSRTWVPRGMRDRAWARLRQWLHRLNPRSGKGVLDPSHFDNLPIPVTRVLKERPVTDADVPDADVVVATWWETAHWVNALSPSKGAKAYFVQDYGAHEGQSMEAVAATWHLPLHKIAISRWIMSLIQQYSPGGGDVDYVPNAVDLDRFHAPPRGKQPKPTVGMLYYMQPQKGCDVAVKAIEIARRTVPELQVVSYGPGRNDPTLPLPAGARHWPLAPDEKLKDIYASCDAWLFSSRKEGFGLPILEAMACRTPVIATPAGAAPELVGQGGGVLVKPEDPEDMAAAIVRVVRMDEEQWKRMSDVAYATASRYTWDDATDLFEKALRKVVEDAKRTSPRTLTAGAR